MLGSKSRKTTPKRVVILSTSSPLRSGTDKVERLAGGCVCHFSHQPVFFPKAGALTSATVAHPAGGVRPSYGSVLGRVQVHFGVFRSYVLYLASRPST